MIKLKHILTEQSMLDRILGAIGDPRKSLNYGIDYAAIERMTIPSALVQIILKSTANTFGDQEAAVEAAFIAMSKRPGLYTRCNTIWQRMPENRKKQSLIQYAASRMDINTRWHKQSIADMKRRGLLT